MDRTCTFKHVEFGSLKALVTVQFDEFEIRGFKVIDSKNGLWVGMPSRESLKDGKREFFDIVRFTDQESKREFSDWMLDAYKRELESGNSENGRQATVKRAGAIPAKSNGHSRE